MLIEVSGPQVAFRVTYARYGELRDDLTQQMARGGLLVKVDDASDLTLDTPVCLTLILPDGTALQRHTQVLQVLAGLGVAVRVPPELIDEARRAAGGADAPSAGPARHERVDPHVPHAPHAPHAPHTPHAPHAPHAPPAASASTSAPPPSAPPRTEGPSRSEKIQKALHGTRDERNAILRDRDRTLHPFVLKNPQLDADDVVTIAKNAQVTPELLGQLGERKDWVQRPAIALALARNPRTPPALAVRALAHVSVEALRQLAKGTGVLPHVAQAARKKLLG
jgi:hypothetical protein